MNYAIIKEGTVTNIIHAQSVSSPSAVPTYGTPVAIGDTYDNGAFFRNGEKVLTAAEYLQNKLDMAIAERQDMQEALNLLGVDANGEMV